ncbi:hypothetical protein HQ520_08770 [bacterium]|nr:hypothetical protein [bacterium]
MANWEKVEFKIAKHTDQDICKKMQFVGEQGPFPLSGLTIVPLFSGEPIRFDSVTSAINGPEGQPILSHSSELVKSFGFVFAKGITVRIRRNPNGIAADNLEVEFKGPKNEPLGDVAPGKVADFVSLVRKQMRPLDGSGAVRSMLGQELADHYERREAELSKMQSIVASFFEELAAHRNDLERQFKEKENELTNEGARMEAALQERFETKEGDLSGREDELSKRLAEIDSRESRFARRALREEIQNKLAERSERFELTAGTRMLRQPVKVFIRLLLGVFLALLAVYTYAAIRMVVSEDSLAFQEWVVILIKQALSAAAFVSMSVFSVVP